MKNQAIQQDAILTEQEVAEAGYVSPEIREVGTVEELTHGSREQTADSGSGYQGG